MIVKFYCELLDEHIEIDVDYEVLEKERQTLEHPGCEGGIEIGDVRLIMTDKISEIIKEYIEEQILENWYCDVVKAIQSNYDPT